MPDEPHLERNRADEQHLVSSHLSRWFSTSQMGARDVFLLLIPLIVNQAFLTCFSSISLLLVSYSGQGAISAVSTIGYLDVAIGSVLTAIATAGSILVARSVGAQNGRSLHAGVKGTFQVTTIPGLLIGLVLVVFYGPVTHALVGSLGDDAVSAGEIYLVGLAISYPARAVVESASAAFRGISRTLPALLLTVAASGGFLLLASILVVGGGDGRRRHRHLARRLLLRERSALLLVRAQ